MKAQEIIQRFGSLKDVIYAYDDENIYGYGRSLDEHGVPTLLKTWYEVMDAALQGCTYNEFDPDVVYEEIQKFPYHEQFSYSPGRESSVVMYIICNGGRGNIDRIARLKQFADYLRKTKINADELDVMDKTPFGNTPAIRIWWD